MTRSDRFFERDSETGWKMREVEAMSKDGCNNRLCIRGGHHCVHRHERGKLRTCLGDTDEREDVERRRESAYILVQVRRHALPRLSKTRVQKERGAGGPPVSPGGMAYGYRRIHASSHWDHASR